MGWVMIVAILLVCFSPFWVCICASKPVRRELSVLLTADEILNLRTSWYVEVTQYSCRCSIIGLLWATKPNPTLKHSWLRCYYARDDAANHSCWQRLQVKYVTISQAVSR